MPSTLESVEPSAPGEPLDDTRLDAVFSSLSDPVRRSILVRLYDRPQLVSEIAGHYPISLQAVSRHIQVLVRSGLVRQERSGRVSLCRLEIEPMVSAAGWIDRYSDHWQGRLEKLALKQETRERKRAKKAGKKKKKDKKKRRDANGSDEP